MLTLFLKEQVESSSSWFGVCVQFVSNQYLFHKDSNWGLASFSAFYVFMSKENIPLTDYTIRTLRVSIVPTWIHVQNGKNIWSALMRSLGPSRIYRLRLEINTPYSLLFLHYNSYIAGQYLFASGLQIYTYISPGKYLIIYVEESWLTLFL